MNYDIAIIGGGPAGYTAAERAAEGGLKTVLFEKNAIGAFPQKRYYTPPKYWTASKHPPNMAFCRKGRRLSTWTRSSGVRTGRSKS